MIRLAFVSCVEGPGRSRESEGDGGHDDGTGRRGAIGRATGIDVAGGVVQVDLIDDDHRDEAVAIGDAQAGALTQAVAGTGVDRNQGATGGIGADIGDACTEALGGGGGASRGTAGGVGTLLQGDDGFLQRADGRLGDFELRDQVVDAIGQSDLLAGVAQQVVAEAAEFLGAGGVEFLGGGDERGELIDARGVGRLRGFEPSVLGREAGEIAFQLSSLLSWLVSRSASRIRDSASF